MHQHRWRRLRLSKHVLECHGHLRRVEHVGNLDEAAAHRKRNALKPHKRLGTPLSPVASPRLLSRPPMRSNLRVVTRLQRASIHNRPGRAARMDVAAGTPSQSGGGGGGGGGGGEGNAAHTARAVEWGTTRVSTANRKATQQRATGRTGRAHGSETQLSHGVGVP